MNLLAKRALVFQAMWRVLTLVAASIILGLTLGSAAWNGVNFVMAMYLLFSLSAFVGLVVALIMWSSNKPLFVWISGLSALVVALGASIFSLGFLHGRDTSVPLNDPIEIFGINGPLL